MFNQMNPQLLQMLMQQIQGGGNGFQQPGSMPANGAPSLPQPGNRGASIGMTQMPSAFTPNGQMNGQPGGQLGAGMFGSMSPNMLQMMQQLKGPGGQIPGQTPGQTPPAFNAPGMQLPWQSPSAGSPAAPQLPWQQGQSGGMPPGIMSLIQNMFRGGGGQ